MPDKPERLKVFYLIFAVVLAAVLITILSIRHRPTGDPVKSVDSFKRAIDALEPKQPKRPGR